ncbi:hypothetical protein [Haloarchaeobius iranensis]|uniref:Adhesin n=1 Tax=Haloarchaeobius iranensis TaxID=996166 RepID=A0A1G9YQM1_9EURY|nr:hypothetical protein [Haloarchaeobius iranensis]SDN10823.1 hypothetical protein SAMN05192554_11566 [Haloarchaeobius iranensis]
MNRRSFLGAGAVVLATAIAGCTTFNVQSSETTTDSISADDIDRIRVSNAVGDVTVTGADIDRIEYSAEKRLRGEGEDFDRLTVTVATSDGLLELIGGFSGSSSVFEDRGSITLAVRVPRDLVVEAVDVDVGRVSLRDTTGDSIVRVGVGAVEARRVDGFLDLSTQTGSLDATDIAGLDHASTDIGDVTVEVRGLRRDVDIGTGIGAVEVRVLSELDLELDLRGSSVESDLSLTDTTREGDHITGRLNGGGYRLRVGSDLGEARVRAL